MAHQRRSRGLRPRGDGTRGPRHSSASCAAFSSLASGSPLSSVALDVFSAAHLRVGRPLVYRVPALLHPLQHGTALGHDAAAVSPTCLAGLPLHLHPLPPGRVQPRRQRGDRATRGARAVGHISGSREARHRGAALREIRRVPLRRHSQPEQSDRHGVVLLAAVASVVHAGADGVPRGA